MIERKTWQEFRNAGMMWWINRILHIMGWSIVVSVDEETGDITECFPARVKYRGFDNNSEMKGHQKVTQYIADNIDDLKNEV